MSGIRETPAPTKWEDAAELICAAVLDRSDNTIRKLTDEIYEGMLNDVQSYLRDNVDYNLKQELATAKREADTARALVVEMKAALWVQVSEHKRLCEALGMDEQTHKDGTAQAMRALRMAGGL